MRFRKTAVVAITLVPLCVAVSATASDRPNAPMSQSAPIGGAALSKIDDLLAHAEAQPLENLEGVNDNRVPDDVQSLADQLWQEQPPGFGDVAWDSASGMATVWWHGRIDPAAREVIANIQTPTEVQAMTYSKAELSRAARSLLGEPGGRFTTAAAKVDGSGIEVTVSADSARSAQTDSLDNSKYPVEIIPGGEVLPAADDRKQTPYAPYAGGASIINGASTVKACSSGWPVLIDNSNQTLPRKYGMMFASHCVTNTTSNIWTTWPSEEFSGQRFFFGYMSLSTYRSGEADAAIMVNDPVASGISDPTKIYYPYVYVGPPVGATRYIVTASAAPVIGANWCLGGAPSGTTCNNTVNSTGIFANYGPEYPIAGPLVRTQSISGLANVGQGDSGGPAHLTSGTGSPLVQVTGIISGIDRAGQGPCRMNNDGRMCSSIGLISPYALIQNNLGIRAMTATNYTE